MHYYFNHSFIQQKCIEHCIFLGTVVAYSLTFQSSRPVRFLTRCLIIGSSTIYKPLVYLRANSTEGGISSLPALYLLLCVDSTIFFKKWQNL